MSIQHILCEAIKTKSLVQFLYDGTIRKVEPHMVAHTQDDNIALSGWYIAGYSESHGGHGWRTYLLSEISHLTILEERLSEPRPGYASGGGERFNTIICRL